MFIINALGGSGSSFIFRALEKTCYGLPLFGVNPYRMKIILEKYPYLIPSLNFLLTILGRYVPNPLVLMRPDRFWTEWKFNETGTYDPLHPQYQELLQSHRIYLVQTRYLRSAGIKVSKNKLSSASLTELVGSYLEVMRTAEIERSVNIVLISGHWGEYGIYKELGVETIYIIRDPYNSLISHSKEKRHAKDYRKIGLIHINTPAWIDNYLIGPHHYWVKHAETALSHPNAIIVRYNHFREDWKQIPGLPDITPHYEYKENKIERILSRDSVNYIDSKTRHICKELRFDIPTR